MSEHRGGRLDEGTELHSGLLAIALPTVWLVFLVLPLIDTWGSRGALRWSVGLLATLAFAAGYTAAFELARRARRRRQVDLDPRARLTLLLTLSVCMVVMLLALGQEAAGSAIFMATVLAMILPGLLPAGAVPLLASLMLILSLVVPGWETSFLIPLISLAAGFVMWGVKQVLSTNLTLVTMRDAERRLAIEQERSRFSRDLHDILGHSLTAIAVKAELAGRVLRSEPDRAELELAEIGVLTRNALADVRHAVTGNVELSLAGELVRARQALASAGIDADLPPTVDEVAGPARELFAWALREGITNVLRHGRATHCTVQVTPTRMVITNDGVAEMLDDGKGTGLLGLSRRAAAVGAAVSARVLEPGGFELVVEMDR